MTDYLITLDNNSYNKEYTLGVDYSIPLKQVQYSNLLLDDIGNLFNGITQTFSLTVNGEPYVPTSEQQLIISINDVVLDPGNDYQVSGSSIYFTNPPTSGHSFFGVALVTAADLTRTVVFVLDNGSQDIVPGSKGYLSLDVSGTIQSWTVVSEDTGSIAIDILKTNYSNFPNGFSSIVGSQFPRLSSQDKNRDENLMTWNDTVSAGDILDFRVLSCSGISKCSVFLKLRL